MKIRRSSKFQKFLAKLKLTPEVLREMDQRMKHVTGQDGLSVREKVDYVLKDPGLINLYTGALRYPPLPKGMSFNAPFWGRAETPINF